MTVSEVILLEEAIDDLQAGRRFYEKREEGIGSYFVDSSLADILSLRLYAGIHSIRYDYYRMLIKRFPFAAYYEIHEGVARVVAVLDMRSDPQAIQSILTGRKSNK